MEHTNRLTYLDNIKLFLTVLIVIHHAAVGYGAPGSWPVTDKATDAISPILLTLFVAVSQSFVLSLFFLISGYFVRESWNHSTPKKFFYKKIKRLGIPVLIYALFISPLVRFTASIPKQGYSIHGLWDAFVQTYARLPFEWKAGPLWFLEALLIFSFVYGLYKVLTAEGFPVRHNRGLPGLRFLLTLFQVLVVGSFLVRLYQPVGEVWFHFQLGHFTHYIVFFCLGLLAHKHEWLSKLSQINAKPWRKVAVANLAVMPVIFAINPNPSIYMGGVNVFALLLCLWESVSVLTLSFWVLTLFQKNKRENNGLIRTLTQNAFGVYSIHILTLSFLIGIFLPVPLPSLVKFVMVVAIGLPLTFGLSHFVLRKLPVVGRFF